MYVIHINNIKICIFSSCYRRGRQRDSPWPQKHMPGCDLPQEPTWKGAERPMMTVSREGGRRNRIFNQKKEFGRGVSPERPDENSV